jgi:hypothetical protein
MSRWTATPGSFWCRTVRPIAIAGTTQHLGAAEALDAALLINPYDTEGVADTLKHATEMSREEKAQRMARLHMHLAEHNIYKWLADIFTTLEHIQGASDSAALAVVEAPGGGIPVIGGSLRREEESSTMVSIPIENETPYTLTDAMRQDIRRDAQEHFGDMVRSIRVQEGLERHVFNARTRQVRYAFSPTDFGLMRLIPPAPATVDHAAALSPGQVGVRDEAALERRATLPEHVEGRDADAQEDDVFTLDNPVEDDEDEEERLLDDEDEE